MVNPTGNNWGELDEQTGPSRIEQTFEVLVFLAVIVPSEILSYFVLQAGTANFVLSATATIVRDLALVALILFFLWHNREGLPRIGWTWRSFWANVGIGIGLFIPFTLAAGLIESVLRAAGLSAPSAPLPSFLTAAGAGQYVLAFFLVAVVAVAEETIFRGYLILRFGNTTRSLAAAVILSTGVFALGHGYEGSAGIATVAFMGIVFALVYIWRGSLVAPMVLHFLQDFISIIVLPLLMPH